MLLGILEAMNATRIALPKERIGLSTREVKRRIRRIISEADPASTAVRAAANAVSAAVIAAIGASSAVGAAAG
ncbi:hypothetical protein [Actinomyces gaoshouyii]|uniref:Uncharacterized protein n=1 Tax=Actinomyces gaoshouyii TaxID=1960083 RepID=A0A8H9H745_9ACTO|nr:hypothetical protein [Actinomyces gaoshouyii]GGO94813.1 hypothetical protein GCM10011612_01140 [Actinomyces gaoshouyii]